MKRIIIGNKITKIITVVSSYLVPFLVLSLSNCLYSIESEEESGGYGPPIMLSDPSQEVKPTHDYFSLITIPYSGYSIIVEALYALNEKEAVWHTRFPSHQYIPTEKGFLHTHFCLSPELEGNYVTLGNLKRIILIRDFRDVAISMLHYIQNHPWPGMTELQRKHFLRQTPHDQLLYLINFEYDTKTVTKTDLGIHQVSLAKIAQQAFQYSQRSSALTFFYEDLASPHNEGSFVTQLSQMKRLRNFLHLDMSDSALVKVTKQLNQREHSQHPQDEKIGNWKKYFSQEHKNAFKKKLGHLLVAFGYEEDDQW